jgi:hypothetical protein
MKIFQSIVNDNLAKIRGLNPVDEVCYIWKLLLHSSRKGGKIPSESMNELTDRFNEIFETDYPHFDEGGEIKQDYIINMVMTGDKLRGYETLNTLGGMERV